ncbi:beta-ketoacyl-ACP synthase III [Metaclostridioides mangenotii]|uniref:beta-ketoacyl-ACP synthase III n=1 Tax=Metaclostridioides mangenotii TaxID=1540 RepID=UPI001F1E5B40|nr:beta-ketoacyl-ACP synthase III [Clostridioides mangenotii]
MKIKSGILGVGSYLPEKIVDNFYFESIMDTSDEWITARTGIKERRVASEDEATSDLAVKASQKALECANLHPEDIDLIILATLTPDMLLPSTACIVQDRIGAINAAAFDVSAACTGFVYALTIAKQFIENDTYNNVLVIGSETSSRVLNYNDRTTSVLFGDGAGAAVIGRVEVGGILSTYIGADGKGRDYLKIPAGGSRIKASHDSVENDMHTIHMAGSDVFKFAVRKMAETSQIAIEKANLDAKDIDLYVPHQANVRIIEASAKRLELNMDNVFVNLNKYGNMSAASIPVALDEAYREGKLKKGEKIVVVGFGGGLTWGSSVIEWTL